MNNHPTPSEIQDRISKLEMDIIKVDMQLAFVPFGSERFSELRKAKTEKQEEIKNLKTALSLDLNETM